MNTPDSRVVLRQLDGITSELAALRRELVSSVPTQRPVDLRPMRRVTGARLLLAIPGFLELWKARVPPERVAGTCLLTARAPRPDAWALVCECGEQVVVPKGTVHRCGCGTWRLGIGDAVLVKRWVDGQ